ncbi:hypothetical protein GF415_03055 [Candidatus Micrarchaeota archaeon]|nr:hypothetical protein [Candidatus Micrarchaeota archaeon]
MGFVESVKKGIALFGDSLSEMVETSKERFVQIVMYLLVGGIVSLAGWIAGGVLGVGAYYVLGDIGGEAVAVAIGALLALIPIFIATVYSFSTTLAANQYIYFGKKVDYFEKGNVSLSFRWILLCFGVLVALIVLIAAVFAVLILAGGELAGLVMVVLVMGIMAAAVIGIFVVGLALYYVTQEMAMGRLGPMDAIKGSFNLMKKNFWETIVFAVVMAILMMLFQLLLRAIGYGVGLAGMINPILLLILLLVFLLFSLAAGLAVESAATILKVRFYKKIARTKRAA